MSSRVTGIKRRGQAVAHEAARTLLYWCIGGFVIWILMMYAEGWEIGSLTFAVVLFGVSVCFAGIIHLIGKFIYDVGRSLSAIGGVGGSSRLKKKD